MSKKLGIKKNDTVITIAGKDKGKSGKVLVVNPEDQRVLVEGVNMVKRHKKARSVKQQSGIMNQEAPVHVSNVMLLCSSCKKATKAVLKVTDDGSKIRTCKKCGAEFDK